MSDFEIRIKVNPRTGAARIASSGSTGGSGSPAAPGPNTGGGAIQPGPTAGQIANAMRGDTGGIGGQVPWFMDPSNVAGSAVRRIVASQFDQHASGGEQVGTLATQAARATAYAPYGAAAATAAAAGDEAKREQAEAMGKAVADAVGAAVEKGMQRLVQTSAQANQTVGGVAARYARAGLSGQLSDDDLQNALAREKAAREREYDARTRVAGLSGNVAAPFVGGGQKLVDVGLSGMLGLNQGLERSRRMAEQAARNDAATGSLPIAG